MRSWVRYLTNDDQLQARRALALLEQTDAVFLPKTVLLEMEWVLRAAYRIEAAVIHKSLLQILGLPMVTAESAGQVAVALDFYAQGFDFADALHLAASEGTEALYTFDERFIRKVRQCRRSWGFRRGSRRGRGRGRRFWWECLCRHPGIYCEFLDKT